MKTFRHIRGEAPFSGKGVVSYTPPLGVFLIVQNMKQIPLTQGQFALVDDEDYDELMKYKWHVSKGRYYNYASRSLNKMHPSPRTIGMSRQIMNVIDPKIIVDHKDGNGFNNQKENLRICTARENSLNCRSSKGSFSKYVGISFSPSPSGKRKAWNARIYRDRKKIYQTRHHSEIDAVIARDQFIIDNNLEFCRLNILTKK